MLRIGWDLEKRPSLVSVAAAGLALAVCSTRIPQPPSLISQVDKALMLCVTLDRQTLAVVERSPWHTRRAIPGSYTAQICPTEASWLPPHC